MLVENGVRELKASIISIWDKISLDVRTLACQSSDLPKGWGIAARPPWLWIRDIVSRGDSPWEILWLRKSPIISPAEVSISSPTIILNGAISFNFSAPAIVLWSATAIQFMPSSRQRSTIPSRGARESTE
jgi:hypothetical protein